MRQNFLSFDANIHHPGVRQLSIFAANVQDYVWGSLDPKILPTGQGSMFVERVMRYRIGDGKQGGEIFGLLEVLTEDLVSLRFGSVAVLV